jgi:hypothetical protein
MTTDITTCVDGVELPVPGTWTVASSQAIFEFTSPRHLRRPDSWHARAREATIVVGEGPEDVSVVLRVDRAIPRTVRGSTEGSNDRHAVDATSTHQWRVQGSMSVDGRHVQVEATLAYLGVWRRDGAALGRFELFGSIVDGARAKRRVRFSSELLADAPSFAASVRGAA